MSVWIPLGVTVASVAVVASIMWSGPVSMRGFGLFLSAMYAGLLSSFVAWAWWAMSHIGAWF